jgi:hypothetical protein
VGARDEDIPSLVLSLTWETDESDLDLSAAEGQNVFYPRSDVRRGYGPEIFFAEPKAFRIEVHQVSRGPSGFALGKVGLVSHDGKGALFFDDLPFVLMNEHAAITLGTVSATRRR